MASNPVRRGQLIVPFGVGAMMVVKDGTSIITAGLDHWYKRDDGQDAGVDADEFVVHEWRLERLLRAGHFRLPPDFRKPLRGANIPNCLLTVPFLRFPQWHFCARCRRLESIGLEVRGRVVCVECPRRSYLAQVPFVAMCARGHLQDFPWREWVHSDPEPACHGVLRLRATGSASLAAQQVECDACQARRNLQGITTANIDGSTTLSNTLAPGHVYLCRGHKPWLGPGATDRCDQPLRGSLRGAGNVYFADVRSAIFLPRENPGVSQRLLNLLDEPVYSSVIRLLEDETTPRLLRQKSRAPLEPFSDQEIGEALRIVLAGRAEATDHAQEGDLVLEGVQLRHAEFTALRTARADEDLVVRVVDRGSYAAPVRRFVTSVSLVEKLRETKVFAGFSRIFPEDGRSVAQRTAVLWRTAPHPRQAWLPAQVVFGEGMFLTFDEDLLTAWERKQEVRARVADLARRYARLQRERHLRPRDLSARFVLLHTFSHLLITRLTFDCGYTSASLRERLYVSADPATPMAGLLIYTAAGDSDGTMGGLVRMGRPGYLEPVVRRALEAARWCSADPVCIETQAQGPLSCNLAACHNCALVPETACEELNRFLDRALMVGTIANPEMGFFVAGER
jgi:uncharacterized protein DUF1998